MNVIKIMGGLGNQLFQYAFGRAQMLNGIDVFFDISFFGGRDSERGPDRLDKWPRYYRLGKFECGDSVRQCKFMSQPTIKEKKGICDLSLLLQEKRNFDGYWQHPGYYQEILPMLRTEFTLKEGMYTPQFLATSRDILGSNSVGVHVRRGDYVFQRGFHDLSFDYYLKAIKKTKGDLFIFSDDILWCKERFKQEYFAREMTFISTEDYLDFELFRLCKQKVIANSTFSWWAAFLNDGDQVVVAPSGWTTGTRELFQFEQMSQADLIYYPSHWIKL